MRHLGYINSLISFVTICAVTLLNAGSFNGPEDSERNSPVLTGGEYKVVSVAYYPEWEPGMARVIRRISIDNSGVGQVSIRTDNVLTGLSNFRYRDDIIYNWRKRALSALEDLYVSTEFQEQGHIIEGNADSHKFYFLYPYFTKIIDAEPGYTKTPEDLIWLAQELDSLSKKSQSSLLKQQYFSMTPLSEQQSLSIINRFASTSITIPTVDEVRKLLNKNERVAIVSPTWLVTISDESNIKIKNAFKVNQESYLERNFFYAKNPQSNVMKMEFISTE